MTKARDLLAAEYEAAGMPSAAYAVRCRADGRVLNDYEIALRAIEKALSLPTFTQGVEAAAEVAEQRPEDGEECSRAYRHEVGRDIAAAIRSLTPSDPWKDIGSIAWLLRRNLEDGDRRMAVENCDSLISFIETGAIPHDLPSARELAASVSARLASQDDQPEGDRGGGLVRQVGADLNATARALPPPPASPTASSEDENG